MLGTCKFTVHYAGLGMVPWHESLFWHVEASWRCASVPNIMIEKEAIQCCLFKFSSDLTRLQFCRDIFYSRGGTKTCWPHRSSGRDIRVPIDAHCVATPLLVDMMDPWHVAPHLVFSGIFNLYQLVTSRSPLKYRQFCHTEVTQPAGNHLLLHVQRHAPHRLRLIWVNSILQDHQHVPGCNQGPQGWNTLAMVKMATGGCK